MALTQTTNAPVIITTTQAPFVINLNPVGPGGGAATPTQAPVWSVTQPTVMSVVAAGDGLSATVTVLGVAGPCRVDIAGPGVNGTVTNHIQFFVALPAAVASFNPVVSL